MQWKTAFANPRWTLKKYTLIHLEIYMEIEKK